MKRYFLLISVLSLSSFQFLFASDPPEETLGNIIKNVRDMYNRGVERTTIANYITENVDDKIKSTNNGEVFEDPLNWLRLLRERTLNTDLESEKYTDVANVAWTTGLGNCEENSAIVYYILKKAGVKENVHIVQTARHSFTAWDLHPSARIDKPSTWGDNALVVDPWLGRNITREEVETNRWFMNNDPDAELIDYTIYTDPDADTWSRINAIYNRENNIVPDLEPRNSDDEDCFIATAVYGDPNAPNIQKLRNYRDTVLKKNPLGFLFVKTYETVGPVFAFFIRENEERKKWVKEHIVEPAVSVASKHRYA